MNLQKKNIFISLHHKNIKCMRDSIKKTCLVDRFYLLIATIELESEFLLISKTIRNPYIK